MNPKAIDLSARILLVRDDGEDVLPPILNLSPAPSSMTHKSYPEAKLIGTKHLPSEQ